MKRFPGTQQVTFRIRLASEKRRPKVTGYAPGKYFAVHRSKIRHHTWTLSHIQSGVFVLRSSINSGGLLLLKLARELEAAGGDRWDFSDLSAAPKDLIEELKPLVRQYRGRVY